MLAEEGLASAGDARGDLQVGADGEDVAAQEPVDVLAAYFYEIDGVERVETGSGSWSVALSLGEVAADKLRRSKDALQTVTHR